MKLLTRSAVALFLLIVHLLAFAQASQGKPGLQPYIPTRIEWLALVSNDQLKQDATVDMPFSLSVVATDHETLLIFVRYQPNVDREPMNKMIETARDVIMITAKGYGWEKWVKIKERVEMVKPKSGAGRN